MDPLMFWELSHYEIISYIKAVNKRKKVNLKMDVINNYNLAIMIAYLNNGKKIRPEELYENLFEEEQGEKWRKSLEHMKKFAKIHNSKKKQEAK